MAFVEFVKMGPTLKAESTLIRTSGEHFPGSLCTFQGHLPIQLSRAENYLRAALFQLMGLLRRTELESDPHRTSAHPCSSACFTEHREWRKNLRGILVPVAGMRSVLLLQCGLM